MEELVNIQLHSVDPSKTTKVSTLLPLDLKRDFGKNLAENADVFTWSREDMLGIDPSFIVHRLNMDLSHKVVQEKRMAQMMWVKVEPLASIT